MHPGVWEDRQPQHQHRISCGRRVVCLHVLGLEAMESNHGQSKKRTHQKHEKGTSISIRSVNAKFRILIEDGLSKVVGGCVDQQLEGLKEI